MRYRGAWLAAVVSLLSSAAPSAASAETVATFTRNPSNPILRGVRIGSEIAAKSLDTLVVHFIPRSETPSEQLGLIDEVIRNKPDAIVLAPFDPKHRLVTLTGEGGIGKTHLAIEVARHPLSEFADRARVAELAPLSDPELVPVTVATALGLELAAGAMSAERVANALGRKQLVLVLDNCEHVIDTAARMAGALLHTN